MYGVYPEEQWCEMHVKLPGERTEVCYLNKFSGAMQLGERPQDFRPTLKVRNPAIGLSLVILPGQYW